LFCSPISNWIRGSEHGFQRPENNPFSPYYDPGRRNDPIFYGVMDHAVVPNSQAIFHPSNSFQRSVFLGVPNAHKPLPHVAQAQPPPSYTDIDRI